MRITKIAKVSIGRHWRVKTLNAISKKCLYCVQQNALVLIDTYFGCHSQVNTLQCFSYHVLPFFLKSDHEFKLNAYSLVLISKKSSKNVLTANKYYFVQHDFLS